MWTTNGLNGTWHEILWPCTHAVMLERDISFGFSFLSWRLRGIDGIINHNDLYSERQQWRLSTDYPACLLCFVASIRQFNCICFRSHIFRSAVPAKRDLRVNSLLNQSNEEQWVIRKGRFYYVNFKRSDSFRWLNWNNWRNRIINHYHLLLDVSLSLRMARRWYTLSEFIASQNAPNGRHLFRIHISNLLQCQFTKL